MSPLIKFLVFSLTLFIASCNSDNTVENRKAIWEEKVKKMNLPNKNLEELLSEIIKLEAISKPIYDKNELAVILETIELDSIICDKWSILLSAKFGEQGRVSNYAVSTAGHCL